MAILSRRRRQMIVESQFLPQDKNWDIPNDQGYPEPLPLSGECSDDKFQEFLKEEKGDDPGHDVTEGGSI
ncbi:MAG: hypothetical protein Q9214_006595, partial [Letrouitia sp. 1 TL-2023]